MAGKKITTPLDFGRAELGRILRGLRQDAGLTTKFANTPSLGMRDSMIRMIENGFADVPIKKISGYVATLNAKAKSGWAIDPQALALAYASLRSLVAGQPTDDRFDWKRLFQNDPNYVRDYLYQQLVRSPVREEAARREAEVAREKPRGGADQKNRPGYTSLNPIQLQLVSEIANRIGVFGSDVVSEDAIVEWERLNSGQITSILAVVTSLGSELQEDFIKTIAEISATEEFREWRYLIATNDQNAFDETVKKLLKMVDETQEGRAKAKYVRKKFKAKRITLSEFQRIGKAMGSGDDRGWDGFYLYNIRTGPNLLIGTFRRCPPLRTQLQPLTLEQWGCVAMNEALRWASIEQFTKEHEALWKTKT